MKADRFPVAFVRDTERFEALGGLLNNKVIWQLSTICAELNTPFLFVVYLSCDYNWVSG